MATITVPDESRRKQVVVGSSAQTSFTFDWVIFDTATDIRVWNGATELVNGTTFSVAGNSGTDGGFDGGTVTLTGTLASGVSNTTVTIEGSTPNSRLSNLAATGPLDIDLLNKDLNRVITMIHQSIDTIKKSPRLADDTTLSLPITFPAASASKVISWNSSANALEATVATGDIANAATKATEAAASATAAASSATASATSATASASSATAAASSASDAATSAASLTFASQSEAETGTNNTKSMTPLRVKQAVDSYGILATDIGTTVQAFDADTLKADTADELTAGFSSAAEDAGTKSSGTFTPSPDGGNFQHFVNGGAHTLGVPAKNCAMVLLMKNNSSAGTLTTSGYTKVDGDDLSTTNGDEFFLYITRYNDGSTSFSALTVKALQ